MVASLLTRLALPPLVAAAQSLGLVGLAVVALIAFVVEGADRGPPRGSASVRRSSPSSVLTTAPLGSSRWSTPPTDLHL